MRRVLLPFEFCEPATVQEAVGLVNGDNAKFLAGGVDLVLKMRRREVAVDKVISLQKISGLDYVEGSQEAGLRIGALASLRQVEQSRAVMENWALLSEAISKIVSVQVKTQGTVVGNLCVGTPASDVAPALYALGAKAKIVGAKGEREISIEELFVDAGKSSLCNGEVLTEITVPTLPAGTGGAFMKLSKTAEDIAKVNVAVSVTMSGGKCDQARIALGSVAPTPIRATQAEESLKGQALDGQSIAGASEQAGEAATPISDIRSTEDYRKEMVKVLVRDALITSADRAKG